jgi:flavin-dependent dehydrogenase
VHKKEEDAMDAPVAILGGGPAGSSAAIELLRLGHPVLLIERTDYQGMRIGESIPPSVLPLFAELGLPESLLSDHGDDCVGICSAWGSDEVFDKNFIFHPYGHGWHVARREFDRSLAETARDRGAELLCNCRVVSCRHNQGRGWQFELEQGGHRQSREAAFLIDASGRNSWIGRNFGGVRNAYDRQIAIARIFSTAGRAVEFGAVTLVESVEEGWWYSAPLPGNLLIVVYLTDVDLYRPAREEASAAWMRRLGVATHTMARTAGLDAFGSLRTFMADTYRVRCETADSGWIGAGAATIGLDPLSAHGVCFALRSGLDAARAAAAQLEGDASGLDRYARELDNYFNNYRLQRSSYYDLETRWPNSLFWSRRQTRPPIVAPTKFSIGSFPANVFGTVS